MKFNDGLGLLSLIISLVILWQFRQILLLVFMAIVLATALNNFVRSLINKFNLSRVKAIAIADWYRRHLSKDGKAHFVVR